MLNFGQVESRRGGREGEGNIFWHYLAILQRNELASASVPGPEQEAVKKGHTSGKDLGVLRMRWLNTCQHVRSTRSRFSKDKKGVGSGLLISLPSPFGTALARSS